MDAKSRGRFLVGCSGALIGAAYTYQATTMNFGTAARPGPGMFPVIVGVAFIVVSVYTAAEAYVTAKATAATTSPPPAEADGGADRAGATVEVSKSARIRPGLMLAAAIVGYVLLLPLLGQYVAGAAFMVASLRILGTQSLVRSVVYGTATGLAISWFFIELLGVYMPSGIFES